MATIHDTGLQPVTTESDNDYTIAKNHVGEPVDPSVLTRELRQVKSIIPSSARLASDLQRVIYSPARTDERTRMLSGRLDRRSYSRVVAGSPYAFKTVHRQQEQNALVWLLMDLSSSMTGGSIPMGNRQSKRVSCHRVAASLAQNMAHTIAAVNGRCAIVGFEDPVLVAGQNGISADLRLIKSSHESCEDPAVRLALYWMGRRAAYPNGTPLSPAIVLAADAMMAEDPSPTTNRLLFVLTDGQCTHGAATVREANSYAQQIGVKTVGMGIGVDLSTLEFTASTHVRSVSTIAETGLRSIVTALQA